MKPATASAHWLPGLLLAVVVGRFLWESWAPHAQIDDAFISYRYAVNLVAGHGLVFNLGERVVHARFGEGVVLNLEGQGSHTRVQVNFERAGSKWLVLAYAGLQHA